MSSRKEKRQERWTEEGTGGTGVWWTKKGSCLTPPLSQAGAWSLAGGVLGQGSSERGGTGGTRWSKRGSRISLSVLCAGGMSAGWEAQPGGFLAGFQQAPGLGDFPQDVPSKMGLCDACSQPHGNLPQVWVPGIFVSPAISSFPDTCRSELSLNPLPNLNDNFSNCRVFCWQFAADNRTVNCSSYQCPLEQAGLKCKQCFQVWLKFLLRLALFPDQNVLLLPEG